MLAQLLRPFLVGVGIVGDCGTVSVCGMGEEEVDSQMYGGIGLQWEGVGVGSVALRW